MIATSHRDEERRETGGGQAAWYCLRSQLKHEHIAAANLRNHEGMEVFVPRLRFRRPTARGPAWITEALFPNYLFARFDWKTSLRLVLHCAGVTGVVHFGPHWPTIPAEVIEGLRAVLGEDEIHVLPETLLPGDQVRIVGGSLHDFEAVITQVMPGRQRVAVLLDFLGRQTLVEVAAHAIVKQGDKRRLFLGGETEIH